MLSQTLSFHPLIILICLCLAIAVPASHAQDGPWNHKQCAVSLTYDDALNVHLDLVIPALDSVGFKGTFYTPISFPGFTARMPDWKAAAENGHELGNHTIFHPCEGGYAGREWVNPDYDLTQYTLTRFLDEVRLANVILQSLDGKTKRTFAYACGDIMIDDSSYVPYIENDFTGARSVNAVMQKMEDIDLFDVGSYMINGASADEMIALVKEAMEKQALLVFLFHGVGGEHSINVDLDQHNALVRFLKANEKDIWIAPMVEITEYVAVHQ